MTSPLLWSPRSRQLKLRPLIGGGGNHVLTGFYTTDYRSEGYNQAEADKPPSTSQVERHQASRLQRRRAKDLGTKPAPKNRQQVTSGGKSHSKGEAPNN